MSMNLERWFLWSFKRKIQCLNFKDQNFRSIKWKILRTSGPKRKFKHFYLYILFSCNYAIGSVPKTYLTNINSFFVIGLIYPLKTQQNRSFSDALRGYMKRPLAWNRLRNNLKYWDSVMRSAQQCGFFLTTTWLPHDQLWATV